MSTLSAQCVLHSICNNPFLTTSRCSLCDVEVCIVMGHFNFNWKWVHSSHVHQINLQEILHHELLCWASSFMPTTFEQSARRKVWHVNLTALGAVLLQPVTTERQVWWCLHLLCSCGKWARHCQLKRQVCKGIWMHRMCPTAPTQQLIRWQTLCCVTTPFGKSSPSWTQMVHPCKQSL